MVLESYQVNVDRSELEYTYALLREIVRQLHSMREQVSNLQTAATRAAESLRLQIDENSPLLKEAAE